MKHHIQLIKHNQSVRRLFQGALGRWLLIVSVGIVATTSLSSVALAQCLDGCNGTNTFQGNDALPIATGADNTAFGYNTLLNTTSGFSNTTIGALALLNNTIGHENTATGVNALTNNTTGNFNTATGDGALASNTSADENTAVGFNALLSNTTGQFNTAYGGGALSSNTTGADNTATGTNALANNTNGAYNTATGTNALANNTNGGANTANGLEALESNTTGSDNTANGYVALQNNTTGNFNTANGVAALINNTTGGSNTANGGDALISNTTGGSNTAEGFAALANNTKGNNNVALGASAGNKLTIGSNNIDIGANVLGVAGEANTIRIGKQGTQKATFIAGISGVAVTGSTVVVNSMGKLGVAASSARFKEAIKPMDKASEAILALKPVSFSYKEEIDPDGIPQFGLVAEQVEKVAPELVARDGQGKPYTVRYDAVNAMLLNEFLKEHRKVETLEETVGKLQSALKEQTAQIQRVSDQLALSRPAPRLVINNP